VLLVCFHEVFLVLIVLLLVEEGVWDHLPLLELDGVEKRFLEFSEVLGHRR
jgi:hypothetical protein